MIIQISIWILFSIMTLSRGVNGQQCNSFGYDVVNGGVYYINPASTTPFSFQSGFSYCTQVEAPILQLPDGNQLTCTPVVEAAGVPMTSTCPINHNQMPPGNYIIFFTAIGTARGFTIVLSQTTITVTPTVTVSFTPMASTNSTTTSTLTDSNTIIFVTTVPAATSGTRTIYPARVITTTTSTLTHTRKSVTRTRVTVTSTKTAGCIQPTMKPDDIRSARNSTSRNALLRRRALAKRDGPDGPLTTTITEVTSLVSATVTLAPTTITNTFTTFVTTTVVTTSTQTVLSGTVVATITAPTRTKTIISRVQTTVTRTVTNAMTVRHTSVTTPSAVASCLAQDGKMT